MASKQNDVTGGNEVLGALVPGLNLFNYILGWISVPIETFLRRDFGERYYTKPNFFAGLVILTIFNFSSSLFGFFGRSSAVASGGYMGKILFFYLIFGIIHFLVIWWRDIMGTALHSFSSGRSWLEPLGKLLMRVLNLFLNNFARILVGVFSPTKKQVLESRLPVLNDISTFTERFVEPFVVFILSTIAMGSGQIAVGVWLILSFAALTLVTGLRHENERSYVLDIRDQMVEFKSMQQVAHGEKPQGAERLRRVMNETMEQVEKYPDTMNIIQNQNPSLADAIRAMQTNQKP